MSMVTTKRSGTDLLYGVAQIPLHLEMTRRQVYHLHDQRYLPTALEQGERHGQR